MSGFPARYPGTCSKCQNPIERGQYISWSRREKGKASHLDCEAPNASPVKTTSDTATSTNTTEQVVADAVKAILDSVKSGSPSGLDFETIGTMIDEAIQNATLLSRIEVSNAETSTTVIIENPHAQMPKLLYLLALRHHVYLYGEPGSGKSTAAKQAADALGVQYGYISLNPQTPDSRLMGFIYANGNYRNTVFHQTYVNGGVFCIDECDNASPSLLTTLNSALENGHAAFPCGLAEKHKDFVLVATGNTCGRGANPMFPERRPFDAAFSERFTFINWTYDLALERSIALAHNPKASLWIDWVQSTREYCKKHFPKVLLTPRASFRGARYLRDNVLTVAEIAEMVVFKGLDSGTRDSILAACELPAFTNR